MLLRPRRVKARDLPPSDHLGIADMWARPRTPEKRAKLLQELNAAMREHLHGPQTHDIRAKEQHANRGLQLGLEVRAEPGLVVIHSDFSVASGMRGTVTSVESNVMGEFCSVTWDNGSKGCYVNLDLRKADHKRRHGPLDEIPAPPSRPGPAPYCRGGPGRPRGLVPPAPRPAELLYNRACGGKEFKVYQYQPEVHKRNQVNIHDDLQQRPGFPGAQNYWK